ncbi:hypothetical protein CANCADRAFT_55569 [Tortispora caseinolytica NRRL Y-17796]|uniref:Mitochondrial group I intron splicing factor CCM1 n=1 Tax=Tortispora caseinolytica NRRL Y-17796 TaxID=767744 RepID=A0A1E4TJ15_9ASCO|nr:hypothetical protein CANCADRAFT_55569 [Tortispora caseinolytica NRRL Y-17796]
MFSRFKWKQRPTKSSFADGLIDDRDWSKLRFQTRRNDIAKDTYSPNERESLNSLISLLSRHGSFYRKSHIQPPVKPEPLSDADKSSLAATVAALSNSISKESLSTLQVSALIAAFKTSPDVQIPPETLAKLLAQIAAFDRPSDPHLELARIVYAHYYAITSPSFNNTDESASKSIRSDQTYYHTPKHIPALIDYLVVLVRNGQIQDVVHHLANAYVIFTKFYKRLTLALLNVPGSAPLAPEIAQIFAKRQIRVKRSLLSSLLDLASVPSKDPNPHSEDKSSVFDTVSILTSAGLYDLSSDIQTLSRLLQYSIDEKFGQKGKEFLTMFAEIDKNSPDLAQNYSFEQMQNFYVTAIKAVMTFYDSVPILGRTLVRELLELPDKFPDSSQNGFNRATWHTIIQWSIFSASTDSSAWNVLAATLKQMSKSMPPNTDTINSALEIAAKLGHSNALVDQIFSLFHTEVKHTPVLEEPELEENDKENQISFPSLALHLHIQPNVESYAHLIRARLAASNLVGAIEAFEQSRAQFIPWNEDESNNRNALFELLLAITRAEDADPDIVIDWYLAVRSYTQTVSYVCKVALLDLFLKNDQVGNAISVLRSEIPLSDPVPDELAFENDLMVIEFQSTNVLMGKEAGRLLPAEAPDIYMLLENYVHSSDNAFKAWIMYGMIQRHFIPPPESYHAAMERFMALGRADAAMKIFDHIQWEVNAGDDSLRMTEDLYNRLFRALAKLKYEPAIRPLHVALKMDISIDTNIDLMNGIMLAYASTDNKFAADMIWDQIRTAPLPHRANLESFQIMLELHSRFNIGRAVELWRSLPEYDIEPDNKLYASYIKANCYSGYYARALDIAKHMKEDHGLELDAHVLRTLYNWTLLPNRKKDVEAWAQTAAPEIWKELRESGTLREDVIEQDKPPSILTLLTGKSDNDTSDTKKSATKVEKKENDNDNNHTNYDDDFPDLSEYHYVGKDK